jgi:hypothetical protein
MLQPLALQCSSEPQAVISYVYTNTACMYNYTVSAGVIMRKERAGLAAPLGVKILDQSLLVSFGGS